MMKMKNDYSVNQFTYNDVKSSVLLNHHKLGELLFARLNKHYARWSPIDCIEVQEFFLRSLSRDSRDLSTFCLKVPKDLVKTRFFQKLLQVYRKRIGFNRRYVKDYRFSNEYRKSTLLKAAQAFYESLDTPLSLQALELLKNGSPDAILQLLKLSVNPNSVIYAKNSDLFMRDYAAISFLRKYEGFDIGIDTAEQAARAWIEAEVQCKAFNHRVLSDGFSIDEKRFFFQVRKVVQRILGACPSLSNVRENLRMGPGSTTSTPSKFCSSLDKLESKLEVSPQCYLIARALFSSPENPFGFDPDEFVVVTSSRWSSVKKTALTDRPIEIPIIVDSMVQLALGSLIRGRLKRFGLDLDKQAEINGLLAKFGSLKGTLATLDLKSASDTISYSLVKLLLPKGWFDLLNASRSRMVQLPDGSNFHLHKFSAMGNGYTFELESLIFLAITLVSSGYLNPKRLPCTIGIFGDDICCPTDTANTVVNNLQLCGFQLNTEKSYITGPFRESCGQDFFLGAPVRPYFQKQELTDVTRLFTLVNGIRRFSVRSLINYGSDIRYRDVWRSLVQIIPEPYRIFGHSSLGDTVVWGNPADGVQGFWPITVRNCYSYRRRQLIRAEHRTINYSAYKGTTLIRSWLLQKNGKISQPFEKLKHFKRDISPSDLLTMVKRSGFNSDACVNPRSFRDSIQYQPKWFYTTEESETMAWVTTGNGCDCPTFI